MGFGCLLSSLSLTFRRDLKPSRRGFFFPRAVPTALAASPIRAAVESTDTVLGAEVGSPGADPKDALGLVECASPGDTVNNPYHAHALRGGEMTSSLYLTSVG